MDALRTFLEPFTTDFPFEEVFREGRAYYYADSTVRALAGQVDREVSMAGMYLGEERKKGFHPSPSLFRLLANKDLPTVTLDEKNAFLFICGRDLFPQSVVKTGSGKQFLVQNKAGDVLGFTRKVKLKGETLYRNECDIGDYLRREKSGR